jgi:hypothetical protein
MTEREENKMGNVRCKMENDTREYRRRCLVIGKGI